MSFVDAVRTCFTRYADFTGRAGRPEYWWWFVFAVLTSMATSVLDAALFPWVAFTLADLGPLRSLAMLGLLLPGLAVGARRLHDVGKSGWLQAVSLIPLVGWLVMAWWCIEVGHRTTNAYGPPVTRSLPTDTDTDSFTRNRLQ